MRSDLEAKQETIESSITSRNENIEQLSEKVSTLQKENDSLRNAKENEETSDKKKNQKTINSLQSQISVSKNQVTVLEGDVKQLHSTIATQKDSINSSSITIERLNKENLSLEEDLKEKDKLIQEQLEEVDSLTKDLVVAKEEADSIRNDYIVLENKLQIKNDEIENVKQNLDKIVNGRNEQIGQEKNDFQAMNKKSAELEEKLVVAEAKHKEIEIQCQAHEKNLESKETEILSLTDKLKAFEINVNALTQRCKEQGDKMETCQKECDGYLERLKSKESILSDFEEKYKILETNNSSRQEIIKELNERIQKLQLENENISLVTTNNQKFVTENEELYSLNSNLETKIQELKNELVGATNKGAQAEEDLERTEETINELTNQIKDLKLEFSKTKEAKETLSFELAEKDTQFESEITKLRNTAKEYEASIESLKQDLANTKKAENEEGQQRTAELLSEMNSMNAELKKRGERVNNLQDEREKLRGEVSSLNEKLKHAEDKIAKLSDENKPLTPPPMAEENMSTSTMSKVEADTRMADIEATFEDRYAKLKLVAIKLKKKTVEQEQQISELMVNSKIKNEQNGTESTPTNQGIGTSSKSQAASNHKEKLSKAIKNLENLQTEYDAAQDIIEEQKLVISTLKKDVESTVTECISIKEKLASVQSELSAKDTKLTEALSSLESCSKDISMAKELKKENVKLTEDLNNSRSKLERLTGAEKRHDLLDLELEEAETRVKQLTASEEQLKEELDKLQDELLREVRLCIQNIHHDQCYFNRERILLNCYLSNQLSFNCKLKS